MTIVRERCLDAVATGERLIVGFDFAFGYPKGAARILSGDSSWQSLWARLAREVRDEDNNRSDRFATAARLNRTLGAGSPRYWGHPWQHSYEGLTPKRPLDNHGVVHEKRHVERRNGKTQPVWKLSGAGAVGSQSFLGIPRLQKLRLDPQLAPHVAVWPFETMFARDLNKPVVIAEIFPSIVDVVTPAGEVRDRIQVEAIASLFARADKEGQLEVLLDAPGDLAAEDLPHVLTEEGWIVGMGHEALVAHLRGLR